MKAKKLLTKGFIPKEFPNLFDSGQLYKSLRMTSETLKSAPIKSVPLRTSIPRGAGFRRNVVLPNPKHYILLAQFLEKKYGDITQFSKLSKISMSKTLQGQNNHARAVVNAHSFEDVLQVKITKGFSSKFLVTADISKFYNTIYTHSIPWALHGKQKSKEDRTETLWGNTLDKLVKNTQDGQTLGIPIGPDTSRIISEIIGVALDKKIQHSTKNLNGIRFIDDFYFFVDSYSEAELLSIKINRAFNEFELTANDSKSSIQEMPVPTESLQLQAIRNYKVRKSTSEQKEDIVHIYNIAIDINMNHPNESSFHYFLTKILPIKVKEENWEILESILLQIALKETKSIIIIAKISISYKSYGYKLNSKKIETTFLKIAQQGIETNYGYEICWAFWVLIQLGIKIHAQLKRISTVTDSLAILSILTAREKNIYLPDIDLKFWETMMTDESLYGASWILSFEAEKRAWLSNQDGLQLINRDEYFRQLDHLGVSFLNMDGVIDPIKEEGLREETDFNHEADIFNILYGV